MNDDIIVTLRHHYAIAGTEPTHPVRRAIKEIERLRAALPRWHACADVAPPDDRAVLLWRVDLEYDVGYVDADGKLRAASVSGPADPDGMWWCELPTPPEGEK